jgi:hypothetical protein
MKLLEAGIQKHMAPGMVDAALSEIASLASPSRIFHLGLDALVGQKPIADAAKHVGWSAQLVDRKKRPVAAAELAITRAGLEFACVTRGPHATGAGEAEAVAERASRQQKRDYELAVLRIPGAYCTALWLRSADGSEDTFIPIPPCPSGLKPNTAYSENALREAILPEARKQLEAPREGG